MHRKYFILHMFFKSTKILKGPKDSQTSDKVIKSKGATILILA